MIRHDCQIKIDTVRLGMNKKIFKWFCRKSDTCMYLIFVCFDALHPSQQFFSHVGMISCLPGLNQYLE